MTPRATAPCRPPSLRLLLLAPPLLAGCGVVPPRPTPSAPAETATLRAEAAAAPSVLLGVFAGNSGWAMADVQALEGWSGKKNAVLNTFTDWCETSAPDFFARQLPNVWNNRNVPMITWNPIPCGGAPDDVEARAAAGEYDAFVDAWAARLKTFLAGPDGVYGTADDRRAYLRPAHEMNGDWYAWGGAVGGNDPSTYVAMWRRLRARFGALGLTNTRLAWVWSVNNTDAGPFRAEQYYPGDADVDWVAVDGYNWGTSQSWSTWSTPEAVFDPMVARLRALSARPVALTEVASATAGGGVAGKGDWIAALQGYAMNRGVRMLAWFNLDKETDWAAFGGTSGDGTAKIGGVTYRTYGAYRTFVADRRVAGSDARDARLLTDAQFLGR